MAVLERLTEEEAALVAILTDPSGSELAEFAYRDDQSYGGRYRLWDMQWPYYHCAEKYQVDASGRGVGKSVSAVLRACAFVFNFPGQEMLVTAPELSHLSLVTDKVEENLLKYRILKEMLKDGGRNAKANGIRKSPHWQVTFSNSAKILSRLPGRTGKGVKGPHPLAIELDELQDFPRRGFTELTETIKISEEGAIWRCHGVSNGVGDIHYELTSQEKKIANDDDVVARLPFFVHRYIAAHRPTWNDAERAAKIAMYGGEDSPDYIRNIFGEPGSASNPVFVLSRLMACVRMDDVFNKTLYQHVTIDEPARMAAERNDLMIEELWNPLPALTDSMYTSYWGGMDVGFTTDPSEVLIFGTTIGKNGKEVSRLVLRMTLKQLKASDQLKILAKVFATLGHRLQRFAMDRTGNGRTISELAADLPDMADRIVGYGFSEKGPVAFDDRPLERGEKPEDLVIEKIYVRFATEVIRKWVDENLLELPYDVELLGQLQMMNLAPKGENVVEKSSGGADHAFDAIRMFVLAKALEPITRMLEKPKKREPVLDIFF